MNFDHFISIELGEWSVAENMEIHYNVLKRLQERYGEDLENIYSANILDLYYMLCFGDCEEVGFDEAKAYLKCLGSYMNKFNIGGNSDFTERAIRATYPQYLSHIYPKIVQPSLDTWMFEVDYNEKDESRKRKLKFMVLFAWFCDFDMLMRGELICNFDRKNRTFGRYKLTEQQYRAVVEGVPEFKFSGDEIDHDMVDLYFTRYNARTTKEQNLYLSVRTLQANRTFLEVYNQEKESNRQYAIGSGLVSKIGNERFNFGRWRDLKLQHKEALLLSEIYENLGVREYLKQSGV